MIRYFIALLLIILWPVSLWAGQFKVVQVVDGDTVIVNGYDLTAKCRLIGVDCPEIKQQYGIQAKNYLEDAILNKVVDVQGYGYGYYNRPLVEIFLNDKSVNLSLLEHGLAEVYKKYPPPKGFDRKKYIEAERISKAQKLGIWSLKNYISPSEYRRIHKHK